MSKKQVLILVERFPAFSGFSESRDVIYYTDAKIETFFFFLRSSDF